MLKDKMLLQTLEKQGFVRFPFLGEAQVIQLRNLFAEYDSLHTTNGKFYHSTFHVENESLSRQVDHAIYGVIKGTIDTYFENYSIFTSNFLIKENIPQSELPPHQDWTFVDETQYQSINIWVPLQDVDARNGCLTFLPKSHLISNAHRSSPYYPSLFEKVMPLVKKRMVAVPAKSGDAIVFYNSTLHGSTPNTSAQRRICVVQNLYSQGAQLLHLFLDREKNVLSEYHITAEDFYKMEDLKRPTFLEPVREISPIFHQLSEEEFLKYYPNDNVLQKIKRWLGMKME